MVHRSCIRRRYKTSFCRYPNRKNISADTSGTSPQARARRRDADSSTLSYQSAARGTNRGEYSSVERCASRLNANLKSYRALLLKSRALIENISITEPPTSAIFDCGTRSGSRMGAIPKSANQAVHTVICPLTGWDILILAKRWVSAKIYNNRAPQSGAAANPGDSITTGSRTTVR
jgi:hypothetical protein